MGTGLPENVIRCFSHRGWACLITAFDDRGKLCPAVVSPGVAVDPATLRFAVDRKTPFFAAIKGGGMATVYIIDEGNVAMFATGCARVVKEESEAASHLAIMEISIEEFGDITLPGFIVASGIIVRPKRDRMAFPYYRAMEELMT